MGLFIMVMPSMIGQYSQRRCEPGTSLAARATIPQQLLTHDRVSDPEDGMTAYGTSSPSVDTPTPPPLSASS
jgi:hypothetical protein